MIFCQVCNKIHQEFIKEETISSIVVEDVDGDVVKKK